MWILYALLVPLFQSITDVFSKKGIKIVDEYLVVFSWALFSALFILPLVFFIDIPLLDNKFWLILVIASLLDIITMILYIKALKYSDLSITIPMLTFTPLFMLITSPIMLGEFPDIFGFIGILLIVMGSYVLNIDKRGDGIFAPFKALVKEKGPRYMLIVAFIWSISANIGKIGVVNYTPLFWLFAASIALAIMYIPVVVFKSKDIVNKISSNIKSLVPIGLFSALTGLFQVTALSFTLASYVISIKRTSAVFSVIFGHYIFKEKHVKEKLIGSVIMVIGVLFIVLL